MADRPVKQPTAEHPITVEPTGKHVTVRVNGELVADTHDAVTLQESTYPAVYYIPFRDVVQGVLLRSATTTYCPYKGDASYYHVTTAAGANIDDVIWTLRAALPGGGRHRGSCRVLPGQGRHHRRSGIVYGGAPHRQRGSLRPGQSRPDVVAVAPGPRRPVLSPRPRRRHLADQPDGLRPGDGADQAGPRPTPSTARHGAAAQRNSSTRCPRYWVPTTTRPGSPPTNRPSPLAHRRVPHLRLGRTGRVLESLDPCRARTASVRDGRAPRMAGAGDEVRRAGPGPGTRAHAGAAVRRRVAAHPVVGVSSHQRRPGTRPHDGRVCSARGLAGAAVGSPGRSRPALR